MLFGRVVAGALLASTTVAALLSPVAADPTYTVTSTDGVLARYEPYEVDISGYGPGYQAPVVYLCFYPNGDVVGPYNDALWYYTSWSGGDTWINAHWLSDPEPTNTPVPGVPQCANDGSNGQSPLPAAPNNGSSGGTTGGTSVPYEATTSGVDPHQMGCDENAQTLKSKNMVVDGVVVGAAYLRYSASCESEWVTATYSAGYFPEPSVWLQNQSGTNETLSDRSYFGGKDWSLQIGGIVDRAGCGGVQLFTSTGDDSPGSYVKWIYLGCA